MPRQGSAAYLRACRRWDEALSAVRAIERAADKAGSTTLRLEADALCAQLDQAIAAVIRNSQRETGVSR